MKPPLSAVEARNRLESEFARLKAPECRRCVAPAPFWGPAVVSGSGYWYLNALPPCRSECRQVLAQVWATLTSEYEIARPVGDGRPAARGPGRAKKVALPII